MNTKQHYEIEAVTELESAHAVLEEEERDEPLHGHSWKITARWAFHPIINMKDVKEKCISDLTNAASKLQFTNLNYLNNMNNSATAECIANHIFTMLSGRSKNVRLLSVTVEEELDCFVKYYEDKE